MRLIYLSLFALFFISTISIGGIASATDIPEPIECFLGEQPIVCPQPVENPSLISTYNPATAELFLPVLILQGDPETLVLDVLLDLSDDTWVIIDYTLPRCEGIFQTSLLCQLLNAPIIQPIDELAELSTKDGGFSPPSPPAEPNPPRELTIDDLINELHDQELGCIYYDEGGVAHSAFEDDPRCNA